MFDDTAFRERALQRIALLIRLTEDLHGIVDGSLPTKAMLAAAPELRGYQFAPHSVPCVMGNCVGHPILADGPITTSQIFLIDPRKRWVRTLSRFYRLADPAPAGWTGPAGAGR